MMFLLGVNQGPAGADAGWAPGHDCGAPDGTEKGQELYIFLHRAIGGAASSATFRV